MSPMLSGSKRPLQEIQSPVRDYPFRKIAKTGRIAADFTPTARKKLDLIYRIKNLRTGMRYTGKTGQTLAKRAHSHEYGINHPERDKGKTELYEAIRLDPENFVIGIQVEAASFNESLENLEYYCIGANDSIEHGYNKNKGKGGGTALKAPTTPKKTPILTDKQMKTPDRGYSLAKDEKGRIRVQTTPTIEKQAKVIYGFKDFITGKWLIGKTAQEVRVRLYGYNHAFDHPEKDVGKQPFPEAVREHPEHIKFYVFYQGTNLMEMEKAWIAAKNAFESGYNQNRGGGGSSALNEENLVQVLDFKD